MHYSEKAKKIALITEKTKKLLKSASEIYGLDFDHRSVEITFDLRGQSAGMALWRRSRSNPIFGCKIRYNIDAILKDFEYIYTDTVPHEVAHLVAHQDNHGPYWQTVCIGLGGSGKRCHSIKLEKARKVREWLYRLPSGKEVKLKTGRHNKVQKGTRYVIGEEQEVLMYEHFVKQVL